MMVCIIVFSSHCLVTNPLCCCGAIAWKDEELKGTRRRSTARVETATPKLVGGSIWTGIAGVCAADFNNGEQSSPMQQRYAEL